MKRSVKKIWAVTALSFVSAILTAQEISEKPTVKVSGYVKTETYFDTYLNTESRDGEILMYPMRKNLDAEGKDVNEVSQFEILGLQSRFRVSGTGGTAFGAKLSGFIEADFLGTSSDYKFMVRLRHAIVKLDWEKTQLLIGQYWHPACIAEFAPTTVLFASGVVFHALNRPAQIRVTHKVSPKLTFMGALSAFGAHRPAEPKGVNSQRNSGLPEVQVQTQYGNVSGLFVSFTAGYKFLRPYTSNKIGDITYKASKNIGSYNVQGALGYSFPFVNAKAQVNYGENLTHFSMIGGYAPVEGSRDSKGEYEYDNIMTVAYWTDFETKGTKVKFGLFGGYTENLGTDKNVIIVSELCRDADLKKVIRIAPRVVSIHGPVILGFEYIYTTATYGKFIGNRIHFTNDKSTNHRIMATIQYSF